MDFEQLAGALNELYWAKREVDDLLKQFPDGFIDDPFSAGDGSENIEEIFELGYLLHDVGINL